MSPSALRYRPRKKAPIRNRPLLFLGIALDSEVNVQPGDPVVPNRQSGNFVRPRFSSIRDSLVNLFLFAILINLRND